jgi:putative membrane protein
MALAGSQQDYLDKAVKRYSSLFVLPSHGEIVIYLALLCFFGGFLTVFPLTKSFSGVALGAGFFLITLFSDVVVRRLLRSEPIYDQRRCDGLSLFSNAAWFALMLIGTALCFYFHSDDIWLRLFLLGFCAVSLLRLLVYSATLFTGYTRAIVSALFQPVLCVVFLYSAWPFVTSNHPLSLSVFVFPLVSIPIIVVTIFFFIYLVNRVGKKTLGVSSMLLLKSFLVNWIEDVNGPLENVLESLGDKRQMDISLLAFKTKKNMKAVMVIPALHPGPFKNVGSSLFPYLIQSALEQRLNCVVSVPHGLFGHELDLASQAQNQKVLDSILNSLNLQDSERKASPFTKAKSGVASAGCQIFGDHAVLFLTVAPATTEDLPPELGFLAIHEAEKNALASAVIVNAHNSIDSDYDAKENIGPLKEAVIESLEKAAEAERFTIEVGAAKVVPSEFSLEDGMGQGGISAIVVRLKGQTTAYVTIDGNNMVSGLREKILEALKPLGIDDGEILTTDTHAVNAVVLNRRGYHPIGEAMNHEKLLDYVRTAVSGALKNLEPVAASWQTITVPDVKVVGAEQVQALCTVTDEASKAAQKAATFLFPVAGLILVVLSFIL